MNSIGINVSCNQFDYGLKSSDEKAVKAADNSSAGINQKIADAVVDKARLKSAVGSSNMVLFKNNTHLKFQIHEKTKEIMVKIIDDETGDTLKEIPPEKILDMVAGFMEMAGLIVDERR